MLLKTLVFSLLPSEYIPSIKDSVFLIKEKNVSTKLSEEKDIIEIIKTIKTGIEVYLTNENYNKYSKDKNYLKMFDRVRLILCYDYIEILPLDNLKLDEKNNIEKLEKLFKLT